MYVNSRINIVKNSTKIHLWPNRLIYI